MFVQNRGFGGRFRHRQGSGLGGELGRSFMALEGERLGPLVALDTPNLGPEPVEADDVEVGGESGEVIAQAPVEDLGE
ncbi:hypothetical protein [Methylobacterium sp. J-090]|uniref:hypothetical protein n=1 Tax=Methylobacterium sp. J-090 TaxID=2836666 RepID=UPI001FB94F7C|nr:hypothetical protein [Methylobacterium sp. J-090]MCJ2081004.1 hypothetical protein [Methylobacterium sp. J-090]